MGGIHIKPGVKFVTSSEEGQVEGQVEGQIMVVDETGSQTLLDGGQQVGIVKLTWAFYVYLLILPIWLEIHF